MVVLLLRSASELSDVQLMQVLDAAADAGADDVKPVQEDGDITGFRVCPPCVVYAM